MWQPHWEESGSLLEQGGGCDPSTRVGTGGFQKAGANSALSGVRAAGGIKGQLGGLPPLPRKESKCSHLNQ